MKLKLNKSIQLRRIAFGVFFLWIISSSAAACGLATAVKDATIDDIRPFFNSFGISIKKYFLDQEVI